MPATKQEPSRPISATAAKLRAKAKEQLAVALSDDNLTVLLRKRRMTLAELSEFSRAPAGKIEKVLRAMQQRGVLVYQFGEYWGIEKAPRPLDETLTYKSRSDGTYVFGFCGDQHLGSKYERLDVNDALYDKFAEVGVDRVFNAGNWIDGEARFNQFDLHTHGMDAQVQYLVDHYPSRPGIVTYAVAGDDHEGWYGQKSGIDIGKHAERLMRESGRKDWVHVGYMEAFFDLVHAKTKQRAKLLLAHPGGGSSYALSYTTQKLVEAFEGGEKPAVALYGHYHKLWFGNIRNVWVAQTGCAQDSTPFMRKKRIEPHVGGGICWLKQDSETGAIVSCRIEFFRYFNRGYYNGRWSHAGGVALPDRGVE